MHRFIANSLGFTVGVIIFVSVLYYRLALMSCTYEDFFSSSTFLFGLWIVFVGIMLCSP